MSKRANKRFAPKNELFAHFLFYHERLEWIAQGCSSVMSNLSDSLTGCKFVMSNSLTVAHLSLAIWANRSQLLIKMSNEGLSKFPSMPPTPCKYAVCPGYLINWFFYIFHSGGWVLVGSNVLCSNKCFFKSVWLGWFFLIQILVKLNFLDYRYYFLHFLCCLFCYRQCLSLQLNIFHKIYTTFYITVNREFPGVSNILFHHALNFKFFIFLST